MGFGSCSSLRPALAERRAAGRARLLELERDGSRGGRASSRRRASARSTRAWPSAVRTAVVRGVREKRRPIPRRGSRTAGDDASRRTAGESLEDVGSACRSSSRPRAGLRRRCGRGRRTPRRSASRTGRLANALRSPSVRGRWGEASSGASSSSPACGALRLRRARRRPGTPRAASCGPTSSCASRAARTSWWTRRCRSPRTSRRSRRRTRRSAARLAEHARQVRDHATELGREGLLGASSPRRPTSRDVRPRRGLLRVAHEHDAGSSRSPGPGVVLASPSTIIVMLRTVRVAWQQENAAEHAQAVHKLACGAPQAAGDVGRPPREARPLARRRRGARTTRRSARTGRACSSRRGASRGGGDAVVARRPRADRAPDTRRSRLGAAPARGRPARARTPHESGNIGGGAHVEQHGGSGCNRVYRTSGVRRIEEHCWIDE